MALKYLHSVHKGTVPPATGRCSGAPDTTSSSAVSLAAAHGVLSDAAQRALRYLESCDARSVAPAQAALARLAELDIPMPDGAQPPLETLRQLDEICSPATMATAGGRFFGFVNGGALPVSVASNWLATAWNQNTALPLAAPATAVA